MKALTLHQPYASLVEYKIKAVETRDWHAGWAVGQRIAIHAGKTVAKYCDPATYEAIAEIYGPDWRETIPTGCVVATAKLSRILHVGRWADNDATAVSCIDINDRSPIRELTNVKIDPHGDFSFGRYLWMLEDVKSAEPRIKVPGRMKLWNLVTPETMEMLAAHRAQFE